jgi:regulator of sigma E protease
MLASVANLWAFILLVGPLILVHELGHLLAAKAVDVKVTRFSIGLGPALLKFNVGETEYCLAPIPLGGYVSLLGQSPHEPVPETDSDRSLSARPLWARYLVLGAGAAANFLLPVVLYFFFFLGDTALTPAIVGTVIDDSAAATAGLRQGDRIVAIDDEHVRSWKQMAKIVAASPGVELRVQIDRDGRRFERFVTPQKAMRRNFLGVATPIGRLGVLSSFYSPQIGIIDPESPAYLEGLRTGDVITSINGEPVTTAEELGRMLKLRGESLLRLTYLRPDAVQGPLGTYLFYESHHAQMLLRKATDFATGLLPANTFVRSVASGSPAAAAGIRPGDRIVSVDGTEFTTWEFFAEVLAQRREQPVELEVQSLGQQPRTVVVAQTIRRWRDIYKQDREALWLGAHPFAKRHVSDPEPIRGRSTHALASAFEEVHVVFQMMWTTLRQLVTFESGVDEISSVVGLFSLAGTAAEQGPGEFLVLMALLSINLGIVNLLPIPILDGGHLLFFTLEAVRRRPLGQRAREIASVIGMIIIVLLLLVALRNDILRYWVDR